MDVLRLISEGIGSRARVASALGMSKPAVSSLVEELISEGLVVETGRGQPPSSGGRRSILLDLNPGAGLIVAVYLNDSWYEVAVVDLSAKILSYAERSTLLRRDYRETLSDVVATIRNTIGQVRRRGANQRIVACGIAIKGLVDTVTGRVLYSASIPGWENVPVRDYLQAEVGFPVYVENDARAVTHAELLYGEGKGSDTFACVSTSWGLGTGVVIGHEVYRGAQDVAVTFAHTTVADGGPLCSCGNRGCWEALASTGAFLRELASRSPDLEGVDFPTAIQSFREGDPLVVEVLLNHTGYWLGVGIANILNVFNPAKLILQGAMTEGGRPLREKIEAVVGERVLPIPGRAELVFSRMNEKVEVKGAAAVVIKRFFSEDAHDFIWDKAGLSGSIA